MSQMIEMPSYEAGLVRFLGTVFHLTVQEYELLLRCDRDDKTKFALSPKDLTAAESGMIRSLEKKHYVEYAENTAKWELNRIGKGVIYTVGTFQQSPKALQRGTVLPFPGRPVA